ncbi:MAG TPA: AgmX/PglI C-terminal domain-containing protein [Polyangia bacterium]|nr:AgmX/PglI C-terminal domain-containing protein [Polyangia bacterium]
MSKGFRHLALLLLPPFAWLVSCSRSDEGMTQRLMEANEKVLTCQKDLAGAKNEVARLKRQLAEAIANPSKVNLTDPDIIELVASRRGSGKPGELQPTLDPKQASKIVMQGATAMQACYERALKKNAALQMQAGLALTLGITVKPTGDVQAVEVAPSVDKGLTDCFRTTASHWKFPTFTGEAVTIEQKLKLTPKT